MVHYLVDFLFAGELGSGHCKFLLSTFTGLSEELDISQAHEKTEGPVQRLTCLSIETDTIGQIS